MVAGIIILIIVIVMAALYTWALSGIHGCKDTPIITAECYLSTNGDYVIEVVEISPDAVSVISVNYIMLDYRGMAIPGEQGSVSDIYCVDLDFQGLEGSSRSIDHEVNVSFIDLDKDGRISIRDLFVIRSLDNGGIAGDGYQLLLKFDVTGDNMLYITFQNPGLWAHSIPIITMTSITHDSANLSLDNEISILDKFQYMDSSYGYFSQPFTYTGDGNRSIDITLFLDGIPFYNDTEFVEYNDSFYVNGNLTHADHLPSREISTHNLSLRLSDASTNRTLYYGFVEYGVIGTSYASPSFSPPPPLQFITAGILFSMFSISQHKLQNKSRKHK